MNKVKRKHRIRKAVRSIICGEPARNYVTAGDRNCGRMMRETQPRRRRTDPVDRAILTKAKFELNREIAEGFWDAWPLGQY